MPNWNRSDNFISTVANRSYIGAKGIFDAFDLMLKAGIADPDILGYYNTFHLLCLAYDGGYGTWNTLRSTKSGKTLGVVQLVDQLTSTKAREWDVATQAVYDITTAKYKTLFPHHRIIFQIGPVESRLIAVNTLIEAIGTDVSLAAVKTSATNFSGLLTAALIVQKNQVLNINNTITILDAARDAASNEAFGIYGSFVRKFNTDPKKIDAYFPVNLLQSVSQSNFTATLAGKKIKKLFHRKLDITKHTLKYMNVGSDVVHAYFTNSLTNTPATGTPVFAIQPNTLGECNPTAMGYTDENRYLHVVNTGNDTANIEIDIMVVN